MTHVISEPFKPRFSLAEVEQRTGLSRDVLRKWEQRYQFPQPQRGTRGQREYLDQDMVKLMLISRLLKNGQRAGSLATQDTDQLQALLDDAHDNQTLPPAPGRLVSSQVVQTLLETLSPTSDPHAVTLYLQRCLVQFGLNAFVAHLMPAFNRAVGDAWEAQRLRIADEHRYTESLRRVVLRALPQPGYVRTIPRVLLTTPPQECHSLALLALHAQLALLGADCIDLGSQTPCAEVLRAVHELHIGVVAISISACLSAPESHKYVRCLRQGLPPGCELWMGGAGCAALDAKALAGCQVFTDTPQAVQSWLMLSKAQRSPS
jgi:DNA-binding transcriptional MerR regulator